MNRNNKGEDIVMQKWIIIAVVVAILIITTIVVFNMEIETEYIPEVEVSSEELRKTMVSIYFKNKATNNLDKENILIDTKTLLKNPYGEFVGMLFNNPDDENLISVFPSNVKRPNVYIEKGVVIVEFTKDSGLDEQSIEINQIKEALNNTLLQLKEVEGVKLLVDGKEL